MLDPDPHHPDQVYQMDFNVNNKQAEAANQIKKNGGKKAIGQSENPFRNVANRKKMIDFDVVVTR